jgi:murein DD-endopeptidase MepM/ murein hydrolase activator NlpD
MKLFDSIKKTKLVNAAAHFPLSHIVAASSLCAALGLVSVIPNGEASTARKVTRLSLPVATEAQTNIETAASSETAYTRRETLSVASGDNLSRMFQRAGLSDRDMMNFLNAAEESKRLKKMKPGDELSFYLGSDDELVKLKHQTSKLKYLTFSKDSNGNFAFEETIRTPDIQLAAKEGSINSSLYVAGQASGMDDKLILALAEIFGWDIDFALDIRKGDRFRLLYEEKFLDGEKLGNGAILSAEFINQKQVFRAVRYELPDGSHEYYAPDGRNMRKAFLRAPLDFRRISSSFNPRRLHPVTKTVKPHRGIDYAAAVGTPVWSSGDGRVVASAYHKYNGNYVVIQHGNNIRTKYLHLKSRKVKKGQKVRQKQIIGSVGTTGLSTGPHLHWRASQPAHYRQLSAKSRIDSPRPQSRFFSDSRILARATR